LEPETTQHNSANTPDKELELKNFTGYVSGYNENYRTGMLISHGCLEYRSTSILLDIHVPCKVLGNLRTTTTLLQMFT
jgi:hypothetical protein